MVIERSDSSVNLPDSMGRTPLYTAAESGQLDSVECLLKQGADPNAQAIGPSELGRTPLHASVSGGFHEIVQDLLDNGAKMSIQDSEGNTPLHLACEAKDPKILAVMQHKCSDGDMRTVNSHSETPLHLLLTMQQRSFNSELKEIARNLAKHYKMQVQNNQGLCALHLAAFWNLDVPVRVMLFNRCRANVKDKQGRIPLHYCFLNERCISMETAKYLVNNNSHPMIGDNYGKSPLHLLMHHSHSAYPGVQEMVRDWNAANARTTVGKPLLHLAVIDGNTDIAKLLVACEVDVNMKDRAGSTALHLAAAGGKTEILRLLISQGAKVNILDGKNMAALHHAAMLNQTAAVQMLIHHKAKLNDFDEDGQTPVHRAAGWGSLDVVRYLVDSGARTTQLDFKGQNAVHVAASEGKVETVHFLISRGVDVTLEDKSGKTPLHLAIKPANLEIIETLLEHRVDINSQDKQGQNALHAACFYGNMDVINTLLQHGANDKMKDTSGRTPEDAGREIGQQTAMDMMVEMVKARDNPDLEKKSENQLDQDVAAYKQEILSSLEQGQEEESLDRAAEPKRRAVEAELEDFLKRGKVHEGHYRPDSFAEVEEGVPRRIELAELGIEVDESVDAYGAPPRKSPLGIPYIRSPQEMPYRRSPFDAPYQRSPKESPSNISPQESPSRRSPRESPSRRSPPESPSGGWEPMEAVDETPEETEGESEVKLPDQKPEKKEKTRKCCVIQ